MSRSFAPRLAVLLALGASAVAVFGTACGSKGGGFVEPPSDNFTSDAGQMEECPYQCSLDGRSVVQSCDGRLIETCADGQACGAGVCQDPCAAAAADQSSNGCEFYLQPPLFSRIWGRSCYAAYVVNTSTVPVNVELELGGKSLDLSKSLYRMTAGTADLEAHEGPIAPGDSVVVFVSDAKSGEKTSISCPAGVVPATVTDALPTGSGIGSSFHLKANAPVNLSAIYPFGGAKSFFPSATLVLPVASWGKQHIIVNAWERITAPGASTGGGPGAQIVASEDDTEVTILPSADIQNGWQFRGGAANVPITYTLKKGQVIQFNQSEELTGSIVTSSKPTSVFGGHECMFIPSGRQACDTALQQLPSFEQWGSKYVGVGYRPRGGDETELMPYRIVAAREDTLLDWDPAAPAGAPLSMKAGEVATFWATTGTAFSVRTQDVDHPIYLAAYMSGGGVPNYGTDLLGATNWETGDPEFVNVIPAGQYLNAYSFYADPTYEETSLVVVRQKQRGAFNDVWLECAGNLGDWKPVGGGGEFEWTRVDLSRGGGPGLTTDAGVCQLGLQRMKSDGPFTATIWGWSPYASYAYPGGMAQRKLVESALNPIR